MRVAPAVVLLLSALSIPAFAASLDDKVPDQAAINALEVRAAQAQPREQCFLYAQLVHEMIEFSAQQYAAGEVDEVHLAFTRFVNTMKQEPVIEQLLPLPSGRLNGDAHANSTAWDYIYEPEPQPVIDQLLVRYVEALVYQAVAENIASEQSARMVAMKAASDNAGNVIGELQLIYNKSRQAAITKELSEIVGGAAAV